MNWCAIRKIQELLLMQGKNYSRSGLWEMVRDGKFGKFKKVKNARNGFKLLVQEKNVLEYFKRIEFEKSLRKRFNDHVAKLESERFERRRVDGLLLALTELGDPHQQNKKQKREMVLERMYPTDPNHRISRKEKWLKRKVVRRVCS